MKYRTIVADPPWQYDNKKTGGTGTSGSASKYSTMSLKEIEALPIRDITDKKAGACCFLWVTIPLLLEGIEVLRAWGFKYKTTITWVKQYTGNRLGMGYWYRGHVELALFGVAGPLKPFRSSIPNIFSAPVGRHSEKPEGLYKVYVEPFAPDPKIELFASKERSGWDVWGNGVAGKKSYVDIF